MTHSIIPKLDNNDLNHEQALAQRMVGSELTVRNYTACKVQYDFPNGSFAAECPRGYVLVHIDGLRALLALAVIDTHIDAFLVLDPASEEFTVDQAMMLAERNGQKNRRVPSVSRTLRKEVLRLRQELAKTNDSNV